MASPGLFPVRVLVRHEGRVGIVCACSATSARVAFDENAPPLNVLPAALEPALIVRRDTQRALNARADAHHAEAAPLPEHLRAYERLVMRGRPLLLV